MRTSKPRRGWLGLLCATRMLQGTIATAWAGVMPLVSVQWQIPASHAGLVQSAWHVGYLVSLFGVGFVADRLGPRRVFLICSVLTAMAAALFALGATGLISAVMLYGLTGLCSGGCYGPGMQLLSANAEPERRGQAMGAFIASSSMGYGLALLAIASLSSLMSWRLILVVVAVLVALGGVLTVYALSRMRPDPAPMAKTAVVPVRAAIRHTVNDRPAMAGSLAYAAHCWELMALWAWLPAYLAFAASGVGLPPAQGVGLAALAHVVSVAGSIIGGTSSDRFGRSRVMMTATCASLFFSFTFGWFWAAPVWVLAAIGAVYNLFAIADSSVYSTSMADVVPPERLGAAYSVRSVLGFGAGAISPWVFGVALDWGRTNFALPGHGWVLAWSTAGAGAIIGPWMIHRFHKFSRPRPQCR